MNPEADAGHISAGEANASNFLRPPKAGEEHAWAENLRDKLQALLPCGSLNDERQLPPAPARYPNPFPRGNRHFTGRNRELMRIHSLLHPPRIGGQASNVALHAHGLGGIGKTELALQYAEQFQTAYPGGVYWLNLAGFDPERFSADNIEENAKHAWAHAVFSALLCRACSGVIHSPHESKATAFFFSIVALNFCYLVFSSTLDDFLNETRAILMLPEKIA